MNFKTFLTTFGLIFIAEIGDKTQLAAITLAAQTKQPVAVFFGAALALALVSLIGVSLGNVLSDFINPEILHKIAAAAFILIGALMLWGKI
ncbi:MAG: TMEM165/GDT1 family protein [Acidobacteria bacterium]|jgi:putative Ca2+/H+ antiporter (TMEM165/GDT1 family)|nr:TMEM165/GDT1 family protein [Acidobacteriota bacterium]MBK7599840.1 TMEM165/GDT1 family protein [Acidobacteriota bacterium]MBK8315752.1 TMEM165/GDT1 family protein [Acidobacteriota bacterium]MBK9709172.1 TMEM165/GDT1 family protein [Acidobacteriota bacterium]